MCLVHVLGEGNQAVDALANLRHSLNLGITYYCAITSCILGVLQVNGYGVAFRHLGQFFICVWVFSPILHKKKKSEHNNGKQDKNMESWNLMWKRMVRMEVEYGKEE